MLNEQISNRLRFILLVLFNGTLFACASPTKVDVVERVTLDRSIEIDRMGGNLIRHVAPGETLYSIAFEMGLDVNKVAAWNGLTDTTKLQVGKRIRLTKPIDFVAAPKPEVNEGVERQIVVDRQIVVEPIYPPSLENAPSDLKTIQPAPIKETNTQTVLQEPVSPAEPIDLTTWNWPLNGTVTRRFSQAQGNQGIDIQGDAGQAVLSANAGEVVYVGNSLKGYGNLVIIKHSDVFLSAYAHNSEIFVREGQQISARQRIASVGINRNKQTALHFQIRKNGQPVNPMTYLAKKG